MAGFLLSVVPPLVTVTQKAAGDLPHLLSRVAARINRVAPGEGNRFPLIVRQQAHVTPVLIAVAVFSGAWVDGVVGAAPLTGALQAQVARVVAPQVRNWTGATT